MDIYASIFASSGSSAFIKGTIQAAASAAPYLIHLLPKRLQSQKDLLGLPFR